MATDATLSPGCKVKDTYEVIRRVAGGGMGEVYQVRHLNLDIYSALKLMLPQWAREPTQVARFQEEARIMARISHPNIARVFDCGEIAGYPFLIMEWLDGESLYELAERAGRLPLAEVVELCEMIATALQVVHDKGIVHRDIKPGNVFLCPTDGGGYCAKVLDFGIARNAHGQHTTLPGTVLGTPEYMAPEQARGDSQAIGPRTDQYALAMVAYRMLSGRPAFRCIDSPMATLFQIQAMEPADLPDDVPKAVQGVIMRALSKQPADRYATVAEFAATLDAAASARPPESTVMPAVMPAPLVAPPAPPPLAPPSVSGRLAWPSLGYLMAVSVTASALLFFMVLLRSVLLSSSAASSSPASPDMYVTAPDLLSPLRWQVASRPTGAMVYDVASGKLLGQTPWQAEVLAGTRDSLPVELRLPGYESVRTALRPARADVTMITLTGVRSLWQIISEPVGARVVDRLTGHELGHTPWRFSPELQDKTVHHLRIESPRMQPVELDLDPKLSEDRRVALRPLLGPVTPVLRLTILCVAGSEQELEARNSAVIALQQAGIKSLRQGESIVIKRDGMALVIANHNVAGLDQNKQRIVESTLRERLRGLHVPEELTVKCSR